jgi:transcriptional regulator with XRE-family HTH domain
VVKKANQKTKHNPMTPEQTKTLAKRLKELRDESGLTQEKVAQKMGAGYRAARISNIESGLKPVGLKMIESYAAACGYKLNLEFEKIK